MTQIINGGLNAVFNSTEKCIAITSTGTEIVNGTKILPNSIPQIETQVIYCLPISSTGNALL